MGSSWGWLVVVLYVYIKLVKVYLFGRRWILVEREDNL